MKYVDEYRDEAIARALVASLRRRTTRPWVVMEICGGQTHTLMRYAVDELLPAGLELVHGPGCPVCVTPVEIIDQAIDIAGRPGAMLVSYGDMLRVPGSRLDLLRVKAAGGDVRIAYSPMEAVRLARQHPQRQVVFFGVGFETTAPANAMAVWAAAGEGLSNFSLLCSHVLVPPAIEMLLRAPGNRVQGFIGPGHVCTITGAGPYEALSRRFQVPIVIAGFEPLDLLQALDMLVAQLEAGRAQTENQYVRSVRREGNLAAQEVVARVFETCDRRWRGLGLIAQSGLRLRPELARFDAARRFGLAEEAAAEPQGCRGAEVLLGRARPNQCPAFGTRCTPQAPLGALMVSSEGACAAYYRYRGASGR